MSRDYKEIDKDNIYNLYVNKGFTQRQCAEILGVKVGRIQRAMKKYNIPTRDFSELNTSTLIIPMTDIMYETLRGALLGDGSLQISKNGINATFTYTSKSRQHVEYIVKDFINYSTCCGLNEKDRFDKRTGKYYHKVDFRSKASSVFTQEYNKWYVDGVKHIPKDLVLTQHMCLCWYLGDGCLRNCKRNNTQEIILCTNCFELDEIKTILLPQLKQFDPKIYNAGTSKSGKQNYTIAIAKKHNIKKFLDYIGECPFEDYKYKWDIKPGLLSGPYAKYNKFANEWVDLYNSGKSIHDISQNYKCPERAIELTLKNNYIIN